MDPVVALREIAYLLERSGGQTRRAQAYRKAADVCADLEPERRAALSASGDWASLPGVGSSTAAVIRQASAGRLPDRLAELRASREPLVAGDDPVLGALRGDLHVHSEWSDGSSSVEEMVLSARALGYEYCAITDHSPRLKVAHGLDADRLARQLDLIADLNEVLAPFRIVAGIEVDILDDGSLDQTPAMLDRLDVVVASVHSKLTMDSAAMTRRMVGAIANPRVNVLGHCTGRLVQGDRGTRPPSVFDAEVVFEACRHFGVAVEINSRPERRDPPDDLLALAAGMGCVFSVGTDAHAPGQLEFREYGARRAADAGIDPERIVNTWPVERLLEWTRARS
ncbi:PHP domain-containing protein [Nigerium massiliense]|uniref:PHP domain-containing protein n=1 Tax=Nigerium massiliense TaxID=1522317 RepID=UPI00058FC110|nr:PHP domain-containing protein [Nigerium massiliense]